MHVQDGTKGRNLIIMSGKMLRIITILLTLCMALCVLMGGCSKESGEGIALSFKSSAGYDYLKSIDGKQVTIKGYMATSSPADGSFIFLMNLPFQSCPFCVPNTSKLSNTMEVYPEKGSKFNFTNQAIKVTGTLQVAKSEKETFKDLFGYEFNFKIVDASYVILKESELSEEFAVWQKLADTNLINEVYNMYNYVNFLCNWPDYFVSDYTDDEGNMHPGYYLNPADVRNFLTIEGAQYNYGYKEGYFDSLVKSVEAVDKNDYRDLTDNIRQAEALANDAMKALENKEYTYEWQKIERFGTEDYIYKLNDGDKLMERMDNLFTFFTDWLSSLEF